MTNAEYADYQEAEAQGAYRGHGTMYQRYFHVEFADRAQSEADAVTREDAVKLISRRIGLDPKHFVITTIERDLTEVSLLDFQWLGPIATIMELQGEFDI